MCAMARAYSWMVGDGAIAPHKPLLLIMYRFGLYYGFSFFLNPYEKICIKVTSENRFRDALRG